MFISGSDTLANIMLYGLLLWHQVHGLDCDKIVCDCAFSDVSNYLPKSTVSQRISYEIKVHTQTVLYPIPSYIGSTV